MAYLNNVQVKFLKELLIDQVQNHATLKEIALIKELGILEALDKMPYQEIIKEDVEQMADEMGVDLRPSQLERVAARVFDRDTSDYYDFIKETIAFVVGDGSE